MNDELRLVPPGLRYRAAFLRCARDHVAASGDPERSGEYARALADFPAYLAELRYFASHDEPRPGLVRQRNFWLTDGREVLGHLRLRERLNARLERLGGHIGYDVPPSQRRKGYATRMLALGLREAAARGLSRVLLTADAGNVASIKVILRNGGRLDEQYVFEGVRRRRYWIDTPRAR
jgi:predicted acetyltransferase